MAQQRKNNNRMNMPRPSYFWLYGLAAVFIIGWAVMGGGNDAPQPSDWTSVERMVEQGEVERIQVVNRDQAQVFLRKEAIGKYRNDAENRQYARIPENGAQLFFTIGSVDSFREDLSAAEQRSGHTVPVVYKNEKNDWTSLLINLLPWVVIIGAWFFIMRSMSRGAGAGGGGGIMNVGKAKAQVFDKDNSRRVTFKDVAGLEEAKVEIMEIVDFLKKADKYKELGAKIPKGALLVGPPGTGKTLLAKAVAGEANVPFLSISGSDFVEMFVGVGASRVRDLFEQAKQKAPCIVFIDEIDAIGRARGKNAGFSGNDERENTLNQLLTEMDGFQTNTGVIVLAATNRADILDKALMRAGRFDRQIEVGLPDVKEREEIFEVHLRPLKLDPDLDRSFLARQTPGFSGADIANVCNEAALIAARHNKKFIAKEDFLAAIDRIVGGLERKNKIITDEEKRVIAYHEAGHATVSWILENASPLIKVTIIPRGKALGAAWYLPEERQITTREQLMDELAATLGGRVSEQLTFGEVSTGALNDLERVTKQAYAMVAYYGMSENVGTLSYYDSTGQSDMAFTKPYSELTAQQIDAEARRVIEQAYAMAEKVLREHADGVKELAELLLSREVVFTEDVERIFGKRKKDIERERREAEAKAAAERNAAGNVPQPAAEETSGAAVPGTGSAVSEPAGPAASGAASEKVSETAASGKSGGK
ncbi:MULTISPECIES: ATP-dependent zinc metalloprotease FtsH [Alistipes]|uniref:ATP-dependent zinc metalloprotease FtsH n=2 Tax=Alistipes dispar TaxID=2585119 RepID=A0A4Y1X386_9BACT|nr:MULTISPECIES: ATP-dependent zinc metalloprotease FtsH [Alistipes]MBQ4902603.1 ATP-dependent zinc metalloprotease FtsH [Alistipes sp. Marseille-P2263]MCI2257885.1 ATP-dependent zinc metalloprotease FtsH [Alistipes dispar]BBL07214.1 ATP-dependent zinc metalloprotease FtsH [Alistipes dispar]